MSEINTIKPLADRIVVEPMSPETVSSAGIILPSTASEKPKMGTVVAVGPGRVENGARIPLDISIGDVVVFSHYAPDEVEVDGKKYLIVREESVLAILSR